MKKAIWILVFAIPLLLAGCIPFSLYPIYTVDTLLFEPALVGWWAKPDAQEVYVFSADGEKSYELTLLTMEEDTKHFEAHLADIGGTTFLDLYPEKKAFEDSDYSGHSIPVHSFYVVEQFEPTLKILPIEMDWFGAYLKDHPDAIEYGIIGDKCVVTAPTEKVQAFLSRILEDGVVYYNTEEFERIK